MANDSTDTGWQPITNIQGDGEHHAKGQIELARGTEQQPCCMCRAWEKDQKRLIEHFMSKGLEAQPDGSFITPIAKDIPGRKSLRLHPANMGFCRKQTMPTDDLATCDDFEAVRTMSELGSRIKR